ncbi:MULTISPECIES: hypothetical protein [Bacillus cereus group]|uniref:hypothetical protein n=1 Tax=Bacillus cereus group TaxID=86661 RepID=UPI001CB9C8B0|nr:MULTISPECIES: hypothetical protein [Bacillus cereus group]MCU4768312.1 hypothetical protein [Bacillus toyonensis]MDA1876455.1 hypothetical protein [Bacillus cereus group sp. BY112LC]
MLPCQGTCNQHVDFEVLITAPEEYIINDTNYTVAVTWNTERFKCTFEPCTLQTPNPCLLQTNSPDASYPVHSVRIYGVLFLLFKINMDKDQQLFLNGTNSPLMRLFFTQLILIAALILVGLNLRV